MASYIPLLKRPRTPPRPEPRVFSLDDDEIDGVLETLSSDTRRRILLSLYDSPATPAELTTVSGSSLQNVHYHLEKLEAADLITPVDVRYSEKGTEMNVYAPASDPLIFVESEETGSWLRSLLPSFAGAVALLAVVSGLVQWFAGIAATPGREMGVASVASSSAPAAAPTLADSVTSLLLAPGMLVFVGGALALVVVVAVGYFANR